MTQEPSQDVQDLARRLSQKTGHIRGRGRRSPLFRWMWQRADDLRPLFEHGRASVSRPERGRGRGWRSLILIVALHAKTRVLVIGETWEQPTQLDNGRQLAVLLVGSADRGGGFLGHNEHAGRMGDTPGPGQVAGQSQADVALPDPMSTQAVRRVVPRPGFRPPCRPASSGISSDQESGPHQGTRHRVQGAVATPYAPHGGDCVRRRSDSR
jgi:hypothetical protein